MHLRKLVNTKIVILALSLLLLFAGTSAAQELNFSIDGGTTFGNSFAIQSGSSTTVEVYLSEIAPDTTLTSEGLFGFALRGDLDAGSPGAISAASINPQFDFPGTETFNAVAIQWQAAVFANATPRGANILLGNFQFDSSGAGTSTFAFSDLEPGNTSAEAGWITEEATELDQLIFGSGATDSFSLSLTASAVPEPSSLVLLIGLATAILPGRRFR